MSKNEKGCIYPIYDEKMSSKTDKKMKKIDTVFSISHDKDVDGLNSAAIVWRYAKTKGLDYRVILTDYGSFEQVFSKVGVLRSTLIIITDLGMDLTVLDRVIDNLSRAVSQGCRVVWLDHHQWSKRAVRAVKSLGNNPVLRVNHDFCAAEIAHKVLMPRDGISEELARIAHDTDFNLREIPSANALTDALSVIRFRALDKREDITDSLMQLMKPLAEEGISGVWDESSARLKNTMLHQKVEAYQKEKNRKMRKALAGHCDSIIHDRLVRIVEMPGGVTTTDIGTFFADPKNLVIDGTSLKVADLLITVGQGGMLGFRRGNESALCNEAAKLFNGGGHPYAAGGEYGLYDDFQATCDDILLTLSKTKDWVI